MREVFLPLLLVLLALGATFFLKRRALDVTEYMPPPPEKLRQGLFYCYFHTFENQIAETIDHVTHVFVSGWFGTGKTIEEIKSHDKPVILHLPFECYGQDHKPLPDVYQRVMATLTALWQAGVLARVAGIYPVDEPDLVGLSDDEVNAVNAEVMRAARQFTELQDVLLYVIYCGRGFPGFASYQRVAIDDYPARTGVLVGQPFLALLERLLPYQKAFLVPGGADDWRQDPEAFRRFAHNDPRIAGIMPFMWATQLPTTKKGIGANGMAAPYVALGKEICSLQ